MQTLLFNLRFVICRQAKFYFAKNVIKWIAQFANARVEAEDH